MKKLFKIKNHTGISVFILLVMILFMGSSSVSQAQTIFGYDYGTSSGSVSSGTGTAPTFFNPAPSAGTFFYGFSTSGSSLTAANPGLGNLGLGTEVQCQAGASGQFSKFGVMAYAPSNTKTSYNKFDVILAGSDGITPSSSGVWYFSAGDGGSTKFMGNNTNTINLLETSTTLRWTFGSSGSLTLAYYEYITNNSGQWINIGTYSQGTKYTIEIFSNVGTSVTYNKEGITYTCANNKQDIWINDVLVKQQVNVASTSNVLVKIDSYCFYGEGSNTAYLFSDDAIYSHNINANASYAYYSKSSGNLNLTTNWGVNTDGSGTNPINFTTDQCTYFIRNNTTPTIGANWTVSGIGSRVVVGDGTNACNFTIPSGFTFNGVVDVSNNGTLTLLNSTAPTFGLLLTGSTVNFGMTGAQNISYPSFYNLKTSGTGTKTLTTNVNATGIVTVGDGSNAGTLIIPSAYSLSGTTNVSAAGTLSIQNTNMPTLNSLSTGSTVEYAASGSAQTTQTSAVSYYNLVINNSNGVTLGGNSIVTNTLTLTSGALLIGSNTLSLNKALSIGSGSLTGGSTSNLTIGDAGSAANLTIPAIANGLQNLTLNRASGITLGSSLIAGGNITMNSGNITTGANILTLGSGASNTGTLTYSTGTINTGSTGGFKRWFTNATAPNIQFPVGTAVNNNMVVLSFTSAPSAGGTLTAKFVALDPGTNTTAPVNDNGYIVDSYSARGYWQIDAGDGLTGGIYNLSMLGTGFNPAGNEITNYTLLRILKRAAAGNNWITEGTHLNATGSNTTPEIQRTGMTGFSQFAMGGNVADGNPLAGTLPVELISFTSNISIRNVKLIWTTASEINNEGFEILRSEINDNNNWVKVGYVGGNGTKTTPTNYSYEDKNLNTGKYYYKLKQMDYNGNFEYFVMAGIAEIGSPKKFELLQNYPNPFNPVTKIDYQLPANGKVKIVIYDMLGKEIISLVNENKSAGYYSAEFDASSLASGIYIYRLSFDGNGNNFNVTKRMTLIK